MSELGNQFLVQYGPAIVDLIVKGLLIPIIYIAGKWLASKAKNAKVKEIIADIDALAAKWVLAANQDFVDAAKKAGTFDKAAQDAVFEEVLRQTLATVTDDTMKLLTEYAGDGLELIKSIIKAQVRVNKLEV